MTKVMVSAMVLALAAHTAVFAQESSENTTSTKIENVKPATEQNKPSSGEDVDQIITNKKMRAESGSKSKWSIGTALNYNGGTIETPLNERRPDLTGGNGQTLVSSFGGSVGVGYKMTTTDRLSLDVGVRWISPLQKDKPKGYNGDRVDASNPSITYSKVFRMLGDVQSQFSVGPTIYTQSNTRKIGYLYALSAAQNMNYEVGHSGFSIGLALGADYYGFDKNDAVSKANSSDFDIAASPYLEYVLNDTFNLRTVFNYAIWEHSRATSFSKWFKNENQQSVGVGISITRDIFLYPNIQFQPASITNVFRADTTNVALNTNINLF